jgi:hypothetical protein
MQNRFAPMELPGNARRPYPKGEPARRPALEEVRPMHDADDHDRAGLLALLGLEQ